MLFGQASRTGTFGRAFLESLHTIVKTPLSLIGLLEHRQRIVHVLGWMTDLRLLLKVV